MIELLEYIKKNDGLQIYIITVTILAFFIIIFTPMMWGTTKSGVQYKEDALLTKKKELVDTISREAVTMCNYEDLDKQDLCASRIADRYISLLKQVK